MPTHRNRQAHAIFPHWMFWLLCVLSLRPLHAGPIPVPGPSLPDLAGIAFSIATNRVHAGDSLLVSGSITNLGNSAAGPFHLGLYLADDPNFSRIATLSVTPEPGCDAHDVVRFSERIVIPFGVAPGIHFLGYKIDPLDEITESDESNNGPFHKPITILPSSPPHLAVLGARIDDPSPYLGDATTITLTLTNRTTAGGGGSAGPFHVGVYFSADPTFTNTAATAEIPVSGVSAGGSAGISIPVGIPDHTTAGLYYIGLKLDDLNEIRGTNGNGQGSVVIPVSVRAGGRWTRLANTPPVPIQRLHLLSDGTVLAQRDGTAASVTWYSLAPDRFGSYRNGTWTKVAPSKYSRVWYSSELVPDGRLFVAGGEYGNGSNTAEIYDPRSDAWTEIPVPAGLIIAGTQTDPKTGQNLTGFSDSISDILPDGRVMIAPVNPERSGTTVLFDPRTDTISAGPRLFGRRSQDESSWVKLPDASILTVDFCGTTSQRYIPSLGRWIEDAPVPIDLYSVFGCEIGAAFLLPNGQAMIIGGNSHTALYTPTGTTSPGSWRRGPDVPLGLGAPDAPAAMLPDGNVLCAVGPTPVSDDEVFVSPTSFYEYDYLTDTFDPVDSPTGFALPEPTYYGQMLSLPDGTILFCHQDTDLYVYTRKGATVAGATPKISQVTPNPDGSYHLEGLGFNGISQGAFFGDDAQMNSNFPLVRLTAIDGSQVHYAFTHHWSNTGVATGDKLVSTEFSLPDDLPPGQYDLAVVANGIASDPMAFSAPLGTPLRISLSRSAAGNDVIACTATDPNTLLHASHLRFEVTADLSGLNPAWTQIAAQISVANGQATLTNPVPIFVGQRYYRAVAR